jgi:outer membrane protein assembly factor BamB
MSRRADRSGEEPRESSGGPVELPPGAWDAPPVRTGGGTAAATRGRSRTALEMEAAENRTKAKKRRVTWLMVGMIAGLVLLLGGAGFLGMLYVQGREARDREAAEKLYAEGQFAQASNKYGELLTKYPDSLNTNEYKFWRELSAIRALPLSLNTEGAFDRVSGFLKDYKDDDRLTEHGKEVGDVVVQLLKDAGEKLVKDPGARETQEHYKQGRKVLDELLALNPHWIPEPVIAELNLKKDEAEKLLREQDERRAFVERLRALLEKPPVEAIRQLEAALREAVAKERGYDQDPEVKQIDDQLREKHRAETGFTQGSELPTDKGPAEEVGQGLLVLPVLAAHGDIKPDLPADRVVFALARGVLYALSQNHGDIVWAMRVGIDTAHLPLRVPPTSNAPELALVLSADTLTLNAVNARTGETLWKHRLGGASLGRPVIVDRRVYVPTLNGDVEEIELAGGSLLGRYKLGQPLSVGGTRFGDSKQIFFPGDDSCVYVLDVATRRCQAILYTEHEAGSLRSEPILLPSENDPTVPGYLVLCQAHGLDATMLRTFSILQPNPVAAPGTKESRLRVEPVDMPDRRLRGWPWFPPHLDPEKLITVTDAGMLGLFGIVQPHNKDTPLFPLVRQANQEEGTLELTGLGTARGRAQVVHARGDEQLWVLARGRLLRYVLTLNAAGPHAVPDPGWKRDQPLDLGSPLHESQLDDDGTTLFLVTQSPNGQTCLATAVDAETGRVRWQRQLGLVCHGDPRRFGNEVVALDQGGGLFGFRPNERLEDADGQWLSAGRSLAKPPEGVSGSVYFVPGPDSQSVYQFADLDSGNGLKVRVFQAGGEQASEYAISNVSPQLAGTPAVGANRILLPLADGNTRQVRLPLGDMSAAVFGPNWRPLDRKYVVRAHIVWLGDDDFLVTNGQRGLTRYRFGQGTTYAQVPEGKGPTLELAEDVAGVPVVLSRGGDGATLRVCVADNRGTVYLFEGDELKETRRWALKEPLTAGPFVRDGKIGCVVGRRRLVWLDPTKNDPLWRYDSPGEAILGQPQVADGMVLVADITGRFMGLDPATGLPRGPGYQLRASVGPAAAPAGFSPGRAFAPLTDGTVLLLPLHYLREPLPGLPTVW